MKNISTPLFTILGIFLGWSLTQIGQWYKARKEDNRIRAQVLYNLLEIYHLLKYSTANVVGYADFTITIMRQHIPELEANKEIQKQFSAFIIPLVSKLIKERFEKEFAEIDGNYKASINTLAPIDPIIAYYLNGQTSGVASVSNTINRTLEEIGTLLGYKDKLATAKDQLTKIFEQKVYTDSLAEIRSIILDLSLKIGLLTRFKARRIIEKPAIQSDDNSKLAELLDSVINQLKSNENQL